MLKYRIACVALSVVCLAGLGIGLYVPDSPNITMLYTFGYLCIGGLIGNAVLSVMEIRQKEKKLRTEMERTGGEKP